MAAIRSGDNVYVVTSSTLTPWSPEQLANLKTQKDKLQKQVKDAIKEGGNESIYNPKVLDLQDKIQRTQNQIDKGGFYPTSIVKEANAADLAKFSAMLELNPNVFTTTDPNVLEAMGLNPDLSKGWDGKSPIIRDGTAHGGEVNRAMIDAQKDFAKADISKAQASAMWVQNNKTLQGMTPGTPEYNYFKSQLDHLAWLKGLDPATGAATGTPKGGAEPKVLDPPKTSYTDIAAKVQAIEDGGKYNLTAAEQDYLTGLGYDVHYSRTSIKQFTASLQYKADLAMINDPTKTSPAQKPYYLQQLRQYAWANGLAADGTPLDKGQQQAGSKPKDVPQNMIDSYNKAKAQYDRDKEDYNKYQGLRDLMYRRQELAHQADVAISNNQDTSELDKQLDDINAQINDTYNKINT